MTTWVAGSAILAQVGVSGGGTAAEQAWAATVAAAINAAIDQELDGHTPSAEGTSELTFSALVDGAAAYGLKSAPSGILNIGPDGDIVRIGSDILRETRPALRRLLPVAGIGMA